MMSINTRTSKYGTLKQVSIEGTLYGSIKEAAEAHNISQSTMRYRLLSESKRFELWYMTGRSKKRDMSGKNNPMFGTKGRASTNTKSVRIHGRVFSSIAEAARQLNVGYSALWNRFHRNVKGYEYLQRPESNGSHRTKVLVMADGVLYDSIMECAEKAVISRAALYNRLDSPNFPDWYRVGCEVKDVRKQA